MFRHVLFLLTFSIALGGDAWAQPSNGSVPKALVTAEWVGENLGRDGIVFLDVRNRLSQDSAETYRQGHIPGAVYSDYLADGWRTTRDGIPGQIPLTQDLETLIGGLGIGNDDHVVIIVGGVSALDMGGATRVYFTFKALGHDTVSILDGGYRAYTADPDNPIETGWVTPSRKQFVARERPDLIANRTDVLKALESDDAVLLDIRPPSQYSQETIATALSLPESDLTHNGGYFIDSNKVQDLFDSLGIKESDRVITFCNTGHWGSLGWFIGSEILGRENQVLYDGSMTDWRTDPSLPVTKGE